MVSQRYLLPLAVWSIDLADASNPHEHYNTHILTWNVELSRQHQKNFKTYQLVFQDLSLEVQQVLFCQLNVVIFYTIQSQI